MYKIGIVVVAYNRVNSLARLLDSMTHANYPNEDFIDLIISVDKSNTDEVEVYADKYMWPFGNKIVDKHSKNLGLKKHILSIGKHLDKYDALIVLEDDLVVSSLFFKYATETVSKYYSDSRIAGISLYNFSINYQTGTPFEPIRDGNDVYFMQCAMSWGQIWMKNQWLDFIKWYKQHESFDYSDSIPITLYNWGAKSWLKYHTRYCIENDKFFVYPYVSLSTNTCEVGTNHSSNKGINPTIHQVPLQHGDKSWLLPSFNDECVRYDGFFELLNLYFYLGYSSDNCCLDLNGCKQNALKRRYWLSTQKADYLVVKSYGLNYHPIEENIITNNPGTDIYLYDSTVTQKNPFDKAIDLNLYHFRIRSIVDMTRRYGIVQLLTEYFAAVFNKIKRDVFKKNH